jgi:hypothetical protein
MYRVQTIENKVSIFYKDINFSNLHLETRICISEAFDLVHVFYF